MSKKDFDYKKRFKNQQARRKNIKRMLASSAVASSLVFQPFIPVIQNGQIVGVSERTISAATLTEVGILTDTSVSAELTNLEGEGPFNINLTLTGTGLADVAVVGTDTTAIFILDS